MNENIRIDQIPAGTQIVHGTKMLGINPNGDAEMYDGTLLRGDSLGDATLTTPPGTPLLNQFYNVGNIFGTFTNFLGSNGQPITVEAPAAGKAYINGRLTYTGAYWVYKSDLINLPSSVDLTLVQKGESVNLFNPAAIQSDIVVTASGGNAGKVQTVAGWKTIVIQVTPGDKHVLGRFNPTTGGTYGYYASNPVVGSVAIGTNYAGWAPGATVALTAPAGAGYLAISFARPGDADTTYSQGTINRGDTLQAYTPYAPISAATKANNYDLQAKYMSTDNEVPTPDGTRQSAAINLAYLLSQIAGLMKTVDGILKTDIVVAGTNLFNSASGIVTGSFVNSSGGISNATGWAYWEYNIDTTKTKIYVRDIKIRPATLPNSGYWRLVNSSGNMVSTGPFTTNTAFEIPITAGAVKLQLDIMGPSDATDAYANAKVSYEPFKVTTIMNYPVSGSGGGGSADQSLNTTDSVTFAGLVVSMLKILNAPTSAADAQSGGIYIDVAGGLVNGGYALRVKP
jgi:hypothetical protein